MDGALVVRPRPRALGDQASRAAMQAAAQAVRALSAGHTEVLVCCRQRSWDEELQAVGQEQVGSRLPFSWMSHLLPTAAGCLLAPARQATTRSWLLHCLISACCLAGGGGGNAAGDPADGPGLFGTGCRLGCPVGTSRGWTEGGRSPSGRVAGAAGAPASVFSSFFRCRDEAPAPGLAPLLWRSEDRRSSTRPLQQMFGVLGASRRLDLTSVWAGRCRVAFAP